MTAYEQLLSNIDSFIRRYYKNRMLKGLLLFGTLLVVLFLSTVTLEYFGRFSTLVRMSMFYVFIFSNLILLIYYVIIPLSKLLSFGKLISREQASKIIGDFFPEISDKLYNTLQLGQQLEHSNINFSILSASIAKRSNNLSAFDFSLVINLKRNYKYLLYFIPPIVILLLLLIINPDFIKAPTKRVISYDEIFAIPQDFEFSVLNLPSSIQEGEDFTLQVSVHGKKFPAESYIHTSLGVFKMTKIKNNSFSYTFNKVSKSISFFLTANEVQSKGYELNVIPKSVMGIFDAQIIFPKYLRRESQYIKNVADLTIPEGSIVKWSATSVHTKDTRFVFSDTTFIFNGKNISFRKRFYITSPLTVLLTNNLNNVVDTSIYSVNVIKDAYPQIDANERKDSMSSAIRFFKGNISDDYGLTNLVFHYDIISTNGHLRHKSINVVNLSGTSFAFNYAHDFRQDSLKTEDVIEYYFQVYDNDGVNGSKSTKSQTFIYKLPSTEELIEKRNETIDHSRDELKDMINKVDKLNKNVEELRKETLYSKSNPWENLNKIKNLQQDRQVLQNQLQQMQNNLNESLDEKSSLQKMDPDLKAKYDMLQQLLNKVMDKDMEELLNELSKLLEKNDKYRLDDKFNKLDQKTQDINNQLDRSLELLKRTQVNELLEDVKENLKNLATEQLNLKDKEDNKSIENKKAKEEQDEINDKFDQLKEDFEKLKELNKDLNRPYELQQFDNSKDDISDDLINSSDKLGKNQTNSAQKSQQSAADKMQQMSSSMDAMQQQAQQQQDSEDMKLIRFILKDLISSSIEQELYINKLDRLDFNDPMFGYYGRKQSELNKKVQPLLDSLLVIAKRQPQTASFIDKEMSTIKNSQPSVISAFSNRNRNSAQIHSQFLMTSYNNLALLLNESLQQMQSQMQSQTQGGSGQCDKPGSGKDGKPGSKGQQSGAGSGDMKEMLKKQLEQLKNSMKPGGQKPGNQGDNGKSPGTEGQPGQGGMPSSQLAKMIAEQRMLRQQLEQMRQLMNGDGSGNGNQLNPIIKDLEKQEEDLLHNQIGRDQINRQQDILTRMLESDKALKQRGFENKRQSEVGKSYNYSNQNRIDEYNREKLHQLELFKTIDPNYSKYYKDKASEYFNRQY